MASEGEQAAGGYAKAAQDFVQDTLQRTGTLVGSTKNAVVKTSGTLYEGARQGINEGLKRSGTIYQNAQEGVSDGLKRSGTVVGGVGQGIMRRATVLGQQAQEGEPTMLKRTGTILQQTGSAVVQRTGNWFEGASSYAYSFYDPNAPVNVSIREIVGADLPRTHHTISVIDGRAYIFGGEVASGQLADNEIVMVILPSSGVYEADYKSIQARPKTASGPTPDPRKNHSAVVIGNRIFIFGGELGPKTKEEAGRVWVFDTFSSKWSYLDPPADSPYPQPRFQHTAAASELPAAQEKSTAYKSESSAEQPAPVADLDDLSGTIFIYGGVASKEGGEPEQLNDVWAFDIISRSWVTLPPPPSHSKGARLAILGDNLFRVNGHDASTGEWSMDNLDVGELLRVRERGMSFSAISLPSLLSEWRTSALGRANVDTAELAVATAISGMGKHFILVVTGAGNMLAVDVTPPSEGIIRVAGLDSSETKEDQPAVKQLHKVVTKFMDAYGEEIEGVAPGRKIDNGVGFAFSNGSQVEESHLVIWGGKKANDKVFERGWMITMNF